MDRGPNVNVDRFEHRPDGAVTALLTDGAAVKLALDALRGLGVELSMVDILYGAEGVRIFDRTGREHGVKTRVVRWFQSLGYDENILAVYDEALRNGEHC